MISQEESSVPPTQAPVLKNGRYYDVHGTQIHTMQIRCAAVQICAQIFAMTGLSLFCTGANITET